MIRRKDLHLMTGGAGGSATREGRDRSAGITGVGRAEIGRAGIERAEIGNAGIPIPVALRDNHQSGETTTAMSLERRR
jgi:hypothetical protein